MIRAAGAGAPGGGRAMTARKCGVALAGVLLGLALAPAARAQDYLWPPAVPKGWHEASALLFLADASQPSGSGLWAPWSEQDRLAERLYELIAERYPHLPHAEAAAGRLERL